MDNVLTSGQRIDMVLDAYNRGIIPRRKMIRIAEQILYEERHGYVKPRPSPTHFILNVAPSDIATR